MLLERYGCFGGVVKLVLQPLGCLPFENSWRGLFELIRRDGKFTSSFAFWWVQQKMILVSETGREQIAMVRGLIPLILRYTISKNTKVLWFWLMCSWLRQSISKTSMLIGNSDYTFPSEASTKEKEAFGCVHLPLVYYHKGWSFQLHPSFWDLSKAYQHRFWCWDEHQGNSSSSIFENWNVGVWVCSPSYFRHFVFVFFHKNQGFHEVMSLMSKMAGFSSTDVVLKNGKSPSFLCRESFYFVAFNGIWRPRIDFFSPDLLAPLPRWQVLSQRLAWKPWAGTDTKLGLTSRARSWKRYGAIVKGKGMAFLFFCLGLGVG